VIKLKKEQKSEKSQAENEQLNQLIASYRRNVPNFDDEGICEVFYIDVPDGSIKIFHNKPQKPKGKRPIIFIPGFGTASIIWRDFHYTHHDEVEYYHVETIEKKSGQIVRNRKTDLTMNRLAKDLAVVVDSLGLTNKDYILMGACMNGGVVLKGLIEQYFNPPTTLVLDPFCKWTQNRLLVKIVMPILPPFLFGGLKTIFAKIFLANMKNEVQKERNMKIVEEAVAWKWRKFSLQNVNFDITDDLEKIKDSVYILHGPPDKYHPEGTFRNFAKKIPTSHFFHMQVSEDLRELLAGAFATEFAKITKKDGIPELFKPYEVDLSLNSD
jgi:pimeloyl-ACP methyl ester carboxylesterase